jgi:hypothetical protein
VISVVVLQNSNHLLKGEVGSCSKTCATSTVYGNEAIGVEAERVLDVTEDKDQKPTITVIKTEPHVSCVPVFTVTHISLRLYPELSVCVSVCPCETNILL